MTTTSERDGSSGVIYAFGAFEFDPQRRQLTSHGSELRLTARAYDVLLYLIQHRGQLALKAQLLGTAWRGVVVEESSLTQAIHELRSVLGEKPRDRRYIMTVPGRGYQFVADVCVLDRRESVSPSSPAITPSAAITPAAAIKPSSVATRTRASGDAAPIVAASLGIVAAWGMAASVLLWPSRIEKAATDRPSSAELRAEEARFYLGRRGPADLDRAEASLRAALKQDADSAQLWSGLAAVHAIRASEVPTASDAELQRMRDAAENALRLDPNDAQALVRLAMFHWKAGEAAKARRLLATAAKLAPDDPLVLAVQAGVAAHHGRLDEAIRLQRLAVRNAPLSAVDRINLAHYLYAAGINDEARESYQAARDLAASHPDSALARDAALSIARIDVAEGRLADARAVTSSMPAGIERDYCLALIEYAARDPVAADAALQRLHAQARPDDAYRLAEIHAFRGELDAAFHWLGVAAQAAAARRQSKDVKWEMETSPLLAGVRDDPRWQDWLAANR